MINTIKFDEPCPANRYLEEHIQLLLSSYKKATGRELIAEMVIPKDMSVAEFLFYAPFVVVSHSAELTPIFNYGNRQALALFEMDWNQFTCLPSRQSAEPDTREAREALLRKATDLGYASDYTGIRVSSSGKRFAIVDVQLWNLVDDVGQNRGQAAFYDKWTFLA